jgi:hypothetical protein
LTDSHITQLHLEKGKLHKQSYLRLKHIYEVEIGNLHTFKWRNYPAWKLRLSKESYKLLMKELDLTEEEYNETDMVPRTARLRLEALARAEAPPPPPPRVIRQQPPQYHIPTENRYSPPGSYPTHTNIYSNYGTPVYAEVPRVSRPSNNVPVRPPVWSEPRYNTWAQRVAPPVPEPEESSAGFSILVVCAFVATACWVLWKWW